MEPDVKKCIKCKLVKNVDQFNKRSSSEDGLASKCRLCTNTKALQIRKSRPDAKRAYNLKARFDMTIEEYNVIFIKQKGLCAICLKPETNLDAKGKVKWMNVDHNHDTSKVRGLLCSNCNTGIGLLGDSVKTLKSAIKYLKERGSYSEK